MFSLVQAILRLLGIYYLLRTLDSIAYLIMNIGFYYPPKGSGEVTLGTLIGLSAVAIIFQLMVAIGLFMASPKLARLIVGKDKAIPTGPSLDLALVISSAMLIITYALVRIFDYAEDILTFLKQEEKSYTLTDADAFHLITSLALILAAIFIIKKSPAILKNLSQNAKASGKEN